MEGKKPFIHRFNTYNNCYVYDVNTNKIIKINKESSEILKKVDGGEIDVQAIDNNPILSRMKFQGYLSNHKFSEIIHPEDELLEFNLDSKLNLLILQVTQQCNLRCKYCPYSEGHYNREHSNKKMNFEVAEKVIDFYMNHCSDSRRFNIGFYGGEPLLEFELIKKCVDYAEREAEGKEISFNMTSNATLLTTEIVEYMKTHNISLMISLDGPKNIHDKNRDFCAGKGSFETVIQNLEMIRNQFPEYFETITFNCVMDMENDFRCINEFFTTYDVVKDSIVRFSPRNDDFAKKERKYDGEKYTIDYNYELFKLFLSKIGRLNNKHVSKIVDEHYSNLRSMFFNRKGLDIQGDKGHHSGPCIPGVQRLFVDIYGNFYPCEKVNENSQAMIIGNIDEGFNVDKAKKILNIGKLTEESCKNCWAYKFCYLCAAATQDSSEELSSQKKLEGCRVVKKICSAMIGEYCILKENGDSFEIIELIENI